MVVEKLLELEVQGWEALSSGQDVAQRFYRSLLADDAVMIFPGGMLLRGKEEILESISAQPWESFRFDETDVVSLSEGAGAVVYRVTAQRGSAEPYVALISSLYVFRGDEWKLALHQQTPV